MVRLDPGVRDAMSRVMDLLTGSAQPRNRLEQDLTHGTMNPDEHAGKTYGGFGLTLEEMRSAVDAYWEWLGEVRKEIAREELNIEELAEDIEHLQGEDERNARFDLQLAVDRLDELVDERDEVEAKLQTLRRELNIVEREVRRQQRQSEEPVNWEDYDAGEQREQRREKKLDRQEEQQSLRKARRDQQRRTTEKADMSGVERVMGEDRAREMEQKMTDEWEVANQWLDDGQTDENDEDGPLKRPLE